MDEAEYESQGRRRAMPCGPTFSRRDNESDEDKEEVPPVRERPREQYYGDEEYESLVRRGMPRMIPRAPRFSRRREESESDSDSDSEGEELQHGQKGKGIQQIQQERAPKGSGEKVSEADRELVVTWNGKTTCVWQHEYNCIDCFVI